MQLQPYTELQATEENWKQESWSEEEHTNGLSNVNLLRPENRQVRLYKLNRLYLGKYMYIHDGVLMQ